MKQFIAITALIVAGLGAQANASLGTPLYGCKVEAQLIDKSFALGFGWVNKAGPARITCAPLESLAKGETIRKNAFVQIQGPALGLDINFVQEEAVFMATGRIAVRDANEVYGARSLSIGAHVNALILGAGASVGVEFGDKLVGLNPSVNLDDNKGIEATVSLQEMTIYPSEEAYRRAQRHEN